MSKINIIDKYIKTFPSPVRDILLNIRQTINDIEPNLTETISYGIPTFDLNGQHIVHFAGFKHHIGFYPTPEIIITFKEKLSQYKYAKGSVQFPIDKPIPYKLIRNMVIFRLKSLIKK